MIQKSGYRMNETRFWILDTGCWFVGWSFCKKLLAECRIQESGYRLQDTGNKMLDAGK